MTQVRAAARGAMGSTTGALGVRARVARVEVAAEPVGGPLPDVAGRVVQPEAVRAEAVDRARPEEPVLERVARGEVALPDVHAVLAPRLELVPPREERALDASASRVLPLGLARKPRAGPAAVRDGVVPGDVHDRMRLAPLDGRVRPLGAAPARVVDLPPPGCRGHAARLRELVGQEPREDEGPAEALGLGLESGGLHEACELGVGHGMGRDRERVEPHAAQGALTVLGVGEGVGAAEQRSAGGDRHRRHLEGAARHLRRHLGGGSRTARGAAAAPAVHVRTPDSRH